MPGMKGEQAMVMPLGSGVLPSPIDPSELGTATLTPAGPFAAGSWQSFTLIYTAGKIPLGGTRHRRDERDEDERCQDRNGPFEKRGSADDVGGSKLHDGPSLACVSNCEATPSGPSGGEGNN